MRINFLTGATVSFNRADVLRENIEAVFAACDAAHGRWAKLLGVRALLHPRLRLQDFLQIYNMTKLKAMLDQETWVEVDVPNEFQGIVDSLFSLESLGCGMPLIPLPPLFKTFKIEHNMNLRSLVCRIFWKELESSIRIRTSNFVFEMLKFFNTRACQLVLGAGAMQVSDLKSITSKHLALASQEVGYAQLLLDKKLDEVPMLLESVLSKVMEEFENPITSQVELCLSP
uniref:Vacuolar protein sorting-associated protein 54 C-terminal domain-containing protein n=1 Tax=Lactuca sativa TaxID=4236 RepID=A0A9R1VKG7_LACSA|nr:hypothetical protein LSAT_V11C500254500 [Lactuca sativa]